MLHHINKERLIFALFVILSNSLFSQRADSLKKEYGLEKTLEEVVITGQINNTNIDSSVYKVKIIGQSILEKDVFQTVADVINFETNLNIEQDNILGSGVNIQGISGQNVKILIDDVPVIGRLNGNVDLSQILLHNVYQIEIIEGPLSVSYGTDALAGTINIITKKKYNKKVNVGLNNYYESVGRYNNSFDVAYNSDNHQYSLELARHFFDGWSPNDDFTLFPENTVADTNRYKLWNPKEKIFGKFQHVFNKDKFNLRNYYSDFYEKVTNRGSPRLPYYETAFDDYYYTYRKNIGTEISSTINQFNIRLILTNNNFRRIKNTYFKDLTNLNQVLVTQISANDTSSYNMIMSKLTINPIDKFASIDYQIGFHYNNQIAKGMRILNNEEVQNDYALYSNIEYKLGNLLIRPGFRFIYNDKYETPIIPSINTLYNFGAFKYRVSYAKGFRSPTLKELYFTFNDINHDIVGNEDLSPESSDNYQLNISFNKTLPLHQLNIDLNSFYNSIINKIDLIPSLENPNQYKYYNINELETIGLSSSIKITNNTFIINVSYSRIGIRDFDYNSKYDFSNNLGASLLYSINDYTSFNTFYRFTGSEKRYILEDNNLNQFNTDSYNLLDCSFNMKFLNKKLTFNIGIKNIFDVKKINSISNQSEVHTSNSTIANISYGRSYFTGFNIKL
ncbi:MAG: hypothetical protein CMP60_03840 [Flavobacteriales bacterium]|nr:hypothetical protein [Flavobacteriales bacterium]